MIACFSDPGLYSAREVTAKPVLGIAECGVLTALTLGHRFGVLSILAVTGEDAPKLPAVSCTCTATGWLPSAKRRVSTSMCPGPLGQGTPFANAPSEVASRHER